MYILRSLQLPTMKPSKYSSNLSLCFLYFLPIPSAPFYISDAFPPPCNSSNLYMICTPFVYLYIICVFVHHLYIICTPSACIFPACCLDHSRRMGWLIQILPKRVEGFSVLLHLLSRDTLVVAIPSVLTVTLRLNSWQTDPLPASFEIRQLIKNISEGDQPFIQTLFSWKIC